MNCCNFKNPIPSISTLSTTSFIPVIFIKGSISSNMHLMLVRMKEAFLGLVKVMKRLRRSPRMLPNCLMVSRKPK